MLLRPNFKLGHCPKPDHKPKASAKLFHAFATAGKQLANLHVDYESAKEFKLRCGENKEVPLDWRVEAMKLTKDKSSIIYNDFLTLSGVPPELFEYRLGNRSALEWAIDQYRVHPRRPRQHLQRSEPDGRRAIYRSPYRPSYYCEFGDE